MVIISYMWQLPAMQDYAGYKCQLKAITCNCQL